MTDRVEETTEILIEDLESFRAIDNPMRQRILHLARHPRSVKEIADTLGVPVTRLYYHVNMLEESGFLEVVEVRKSGAQLERIYRSRSGIVRPSPEFIESVGDHQKAAHMLAGVLLDNTRLEVEAVIAAGLDDDSGDGTLSRSVVMVPVDRIQEFTDRIDALAEDLRTIGRDEYDAGADSRLFSFTYAFVPTDLE